MSSHSHIRDLELSIDSDARLPMTLEQTAQLKRLARAAYDFDAFDLQLSRGEAQRRIDTLRAKLKLQGEPPHTQ